MGYIKTYLNFRYFGNFSTFVIDFQPNSIMVRMRALIRAL